MEPSFVCRGITSVYEKLVCCSGSSLRISGMLFNSFSFRSRWLRSARKGPLALRPVSRQSTEGCPRNGSSVCLVEHRSFATLESGMSAASFLHSSFLQAISAVMLWSVHVCQCVCLCVSQCVYLCVCQCCSITFKKYERQRAECIT